MLGRKLGSLASAFALFATALIAVLGSSAQPAAAVDPVGTVTNIPLTNLPAPVSIVTGPDGNLWFADQQLRAVVRLTPGGELTTFPAGFVQHVISGGDGNLWLVRVNPVTGSGLQISRMTTAGVITSSFSDPAFSTVDGIAYGPDGNIWFTNSFADIVGRLTPTGTVTTFAHATIINPTRDHRRPRWCAVVHERWAAGAARSAGRLDRTHHDRGRGHQFPGSAVALAEPHRLRS